jgi:hypothetical protein
VDRAGNGFADALKHSRIIQIRGLGAPEQLPQPLSLFPAHLIRGLSLPLAFVARR